MRKIQALFDKQSSSPPWPGVPWKLLAPVSQAGISRVELLRRV
jgi:hypothetical protein